MKNKYHDLINGLTDKELLFHLYMTQIILLVITFILGVLLFDHFSFMQAIDFSDYRIWLIGVPAGCCGSYCRYFINEMASVFFL